MVLSNILTLKILFIYCNIDTHWKLFWRLLNKLKWWRWRKLNLFLWFRIFLFLFQEVMNTESVRMWLINRGCSQEWNLGVHENGQTNDPQIGTYLYMYGHNREMIIAQSEVWLISVFSCGIISGRWGCCMNQLPLVHNLVFNQKVNLWISVHSKTSSFILLILK